MGGHRGTRSPLDKVTLNTQHNTVHNEGKAGVLIIAQAQMI